MGLCCRNKVNDNLIDKETAKECCTAVPNFSWVSVNSSLGYNLFWQEMRQCVSVRLLHYQYCSAGFSRTVLPTVNPVSWSQIIHIYPGMVLIEVSFKTEFINSLTWDSFFACVMKVKVTLLQFVQRLNSRINYLKWWVLYFLLSPGQELIFFFPEGNAFIRDKLQDFIQSSWGEL